jgi:hypothetical protein
MTEHSNSGGPHETDDEYDDSAPPLWQSIIELSASVPAEEWDRVPKDLAENLDHYLYGDLVAKG